MPTFTGLDPYDLSVGGTLDIHWAPHRNEPELVAAALDEAAAYMENMRPVLTAARQAVVHDVRDHFESAEGSTGSWLARKGAEETVQFEFRPGVGNVEVGRTIEGGGDWPLLDKTGAGKASATSTGSYTIATDSEGGTITFTAMPPHWMLAHNVGLPNRQSGPLPQREWLWLSEAAGEVIFELFEQFISDAVGIVVSPTGGAVLRGPGGQFVPVNIQGTY